MQPSDPGGAVQDSARFVEFAKADVARRYGHPESEIELLDVAGVTWSDAALGCPRLDKTYDQADVPGYRIRLRWVDVEYAYHGKAGALPFLCEKLD